MLKKILIGLGGLVVLVVLAALIIPAFIPAEVYEERIEQAATDAIGRDVTIEGAPKISLIPTRVTVSGLVVANADGFEDPYFARVDEADIGVKLLPLLNKRVEITRFHLKNPDIRLEAKDSGSNWTLGPDEPAPAETPEDAGGGTLPDVSLGDVKLTGGRVSYRAPDGKIWQAEDADLNLTLDSLDNPFGISGTLTVEGEPSRLDATFSTPRSYAENGEADMALDVTVGENKAAMDLGLTNELSYDGRLDIDFPTLRNLFSLAGVDLGTPNGFNKLRLEGPVSGTAERLAFGQGTELTFDDITGKGAIIIDISGARPKITGKVDLGTLDVTPYLPPESEDMAAVKAGKSSGFPEWSTEPMDLSALAAVDTDLDISTGEVILPGITIGESALNLTSTAGDVRVDVTKTSLYGGQGSGTLTAKALRTPQIGLDFKLLGVDAGQAAREIAGITRLRGQGDIVLDNIQMRGASQAALVSSLAGNINLDLKDGAFEGVNLGKIGRAALQTYDALRGEGSELNAPSLLATMNGVITEAKGPAEETDFSSFTLDLGARNGLVSSKTLQIKGPYYVISGTASANLPKQTVSMSLTPAVALEGSDTLRSLPVPITVGGNFNSPSIGVDYEGVVSRLAQDKLGDALKDQGIDLAPGESLEDSIRKTAEQELFKRLSGDKDKDDEADSETPDGDTTIEKPSAEEELLREGLGAIFGASKKDKKEDDGDSPQ